MTIQPLIDLSEEHMNILQRVSLEHNVTAEEYLARVCRNHCSMLISLEEEELLSWSESNARA